ncbi:MAG TPA: alpha/beta fold hydrolase, partial [Microbacteriaceae bacterium]|nr:alpha/beta fold hydrolase [Microbacteriaceae bacterium]
MTARPRTRNAAARIIGIAGLLALTLTACTAPDPGPTATATKTVTEAAIEHLAADSCDSPEHADLGLMVTDGLLCGTLSVPIDRSAADSPTVGLTVVMTDQDAPRGVLLLIGGGPGGSSIWTVPTIRAIMPEVAAEYQLVAMDLRGTGAGALDCPEVQQQTGSSDILAASAGAIEACASSIGAWRDALSTDFTVQDMEDLRLALGAPTWALDGTSYGTFVAARYASSHPESVGALVLDSVVPVEGVDPFLLSSFAALPEVLAEVCASEACETDP